MARMSRLEMPAATNIFGCRLVLGNVEQINCFPVFVKPKADGVLSSETLDVDHLTSTFETQAGEIMTYFLALINKAAVERSVPVSPLQQGQHVFRVKLPPHEQVVWVQLVDLRRRGVTSHFTAASVVSQVPRLHLAQEVHHLSIMAVPVKTQQLKMHTKPTRRCQPPSAFFLMPSQLSND